MKNFFEVLKKCKLFNGIDDKDLTAMLSCLEAKERKFIKNETVLAEGEPAHFIGIVLSGKVQIERIDYYGNRSILTNIEPSEIFGESFAFAGLDALPVNVIAIEDTTVLLIDAKKVTEPCGKACLFHNKMIYNLLTVVARKNLVFHQKIEITSKRSTREKLMTYLLFEAKKHKNNTFTISYDRRELADYLEVDRSGLSSEISKLRNEKFLECRKSTFTLLK